METCYKLFAPEAIIGMTLTSNRFNIEPELTAKVLRQRSAIVEAPVTYQGRRYDEGKKINWRDYVSAAWTLFRLRL